MGDKGKLKMKILKEKRLKHTDEFTNDFLNPSILTDWTQHIQVISSKFGRDIHGWFNGPQYRPSC